MKNVTTWTEAVMASHMDMLTTPLGVTNRSGDEHMMCKQFCPVSLGSSFGGANVPGCCWCGHLCGGITVNTGTFVVSGFVVARPVMSWQVETESCLLIAG